VKLEVVVSGGTGDVDLYVKKGDKPTTSSWDYRPYLMGNNETVTVDNPDAATWFIMLKGYAAYNNVTLKATYFPVAEVVTPLSNGVPVPGLSGAAGSQKFYKIDVPAGQEFFNVEIAGGTGDADLYVKKGDKPTTASWDYRPYLIGNNEEVEITSPAAATWYIMIRGYQAYSGVTLTATYGATVANNFAADPNCVALWRLEDNILDVLGNNNLTDGAAITYPATAKEGSYSAKFDGTDMASIADASLSEDFPLTNGGDEMDFSATFWMRVDSWPPNSYVDAAISKTGSFIIGPLLLSSVPHVAGYYYSGGGLRGFYHNSVIALGTWYHVGITWDRQGTNTVYRIRVFDADAGAILGTDKTGTDYGKPIDVTANAFILGNAQFDGLLDEVAVFNDILTIPEIDMIRQGTYGKL
jgi:hypothetical protein